MTAVVISGTGVYTPEHVASNDALVATYNSWAERWNAQHQDAIAAGELSAKPLSSSEFILKASGIESRHLVDAAGVLDPDVMAPRLRERSNDEPSILAEMAIAAAQQALAQAGRHADEVDLIIAACSNFPRPYPSLAVEVQHFLGCGGAAFDMNVACASAAFAWKTAADALCNGSARRVLVVNPEICSGHLNFCDRDSHFIFGDAAAAAVLERRDDARGEAAFEVLGCKLQTAFSNNIRNNFGFLNRTHPESRDAQDKLFVQEGRKVFKDVCPMVAELITTHVREQGIVVSDLKRLWLHQANLNMNRLIASKVLGREPEAGEAPVILDRYANTSSAGSVIAFHFHRADLQSGDLGILSAFGAGYSAGSVLLRKC